ncbi:MAG: hypothetical protein RL757_2322 [Bacteroidota bacterium]|jgi:hypothetical protein
MNVITILLAGLIPLVVGFLWYNDAFGFGKSWMKENGFTDEFLKKDFNPLKVFGLCYVFGVMLAFAMMPMVNHQMGLFSMLQDTPDHQNTATEVGKAYAFLMDNYGSAFRTFKHGAFHGIIYGVFLALPFLGINGLFERKSWRYIFIHFGYWVITLALVGGVMCQWGGNIR